MRALLPLALAAALAACDGHDHRQGAADDHGPGHDATHAEAHVHEAPHGGRLVVLDAEVLNLELVRDPATGALTAYVLDGHAQNGVQLEQNAIELTVVVGATTETVRLEAVENALTGETKGRTSQFSGRSDTLKGSGPFAGVVRRIDVGARSYQGVPFEYAGEPK